MNIKINNVQQLYDDVCALYNQEIEANGKKIVSDLVASVEAFKSSNGWKGKDAGVQINNVIIAHNGIVGTMNVLGEIIVEVSKITVRLREITNANGARESDLSVLTYENLSKMDNYTDNSETVFISDNAITAKDKLEQTKDLMEKFVEGLNKSKVKIFDNWEMGGKREEALEAFNSAEKIVKEAQTTLTEVAESVKTAIQNWENFNI